MLAKWWILNAVNLHRVNHGLRPLNLHEDNSIDAQRHAQYLLESGLIHRFYSHAHKNTEVAESIGFCRIDEPLKEHHIGRLVWELVEKDEHREHILNPDYTHLATDVAFDGENLVLVQRFSKIE
jgi:uncharacterized protein YkwD